MWIFINPESTRTSGAAFWKRADPAGETPHECRAVQGAWRSIALDSPDGALAYDEEEDCGVTRSGRERPTHSPIRRNALQKTRGGLAPVADPAGLKINETEQGGSRAGSLTGREKLSDAAPRRSINSSESA